MEDFVNEKLCKLNTRKPENYVLPNELTRTNFTQIKKHPSA